MTNDFVFVEGKIPYYQSRLFQSLNIKHAFFTKNGGVSQGCFESLNFALGSGEEKDSIININENHNIAATVFGLTGENICRSNQTHTVNVEYADYSDGGRGYTKPPYSHGVDGMVTDKKDLILSVRMADCVPILLCDIQSEVCGAVHSGWKGTVGSISKNAIDLMISKGAKIENIVAAIGPCIESCCYEVGVELFDSFVSVCSEYGEFFAPKGEKYMLDLIGVNRFILEKAGILKENISSADICTCCNQKHFFSHRRQGTARGVMSAMITL